MNPAIVIIAALLLTGCGATSDGQPTVTLAEGHTLVLREAGISGGYSASRQSIEAGFTVKWGR